MATSAYEGHAIIEIMGRVRLAGGVSEVQQYGTTMIRVDVPEVPFDRGAPAIPGFTRFYGGGAIYSVTPTTEEIALGITRMTRVVPVHPYEMARPAIAPVPADAEVVGEGDRPGVCVDCNRVDCVCDEETIEDGDEAGEGEEK